MYLIFLVASVRCGYGNFQIVMIIGIAIFTSFAFIISDCFPLLTTVNVYPSDGILKIRKYGTLVCFWKKVQFNLRDIQKIYACINVSIQYIENDIHFSVFDLIV